MRARFPLSVLAVVGALACSKTGDGLGNGTFHYACVSAPSGSCPQGPVAVPASIEVGTRFRVTYTPSDTSTVPSVQPVSTDFIAQAPDGTWLALLPGSPAVFVTSGGLAIDYVALNVVSAAGAAP